MKTYLAFDPSSVATGWAYVRWTGTKLRYLTWGCIDLPAGDSLTERLRIVHHEAGALVSRLRPEVVAFESPFVSPTMMGTGMILSRVRAVIELTAPDCRVVEYAPKVVKKWACGNGNAKKDAVRAGVVDRWAAAGLKCDAGMGYDAADALAVLGLLCEGEGLLKGGE